MWLLVYLYFLSSDVIKSIYALPSEILTGDQIISKQFRYDYVYNECINGWLKLHTTPAKWHEARIRCDLEGAELACPYNTQVLQAMTQTMKDNKINNVFTGIHATFSNGIYFSIKGVPLERMPVTWVSDIAPLNYEKQSVILYSNDTIDTEYVEKVSHPYFCYKLDTNEPLTLCGTMDKEYKYNEELDTCYKYHTEGRTWDEAFKTCAVEGGYLAIINSNEEAAYLTTLFKDVNNNIYVGMMDWKRTRQWYTIHGDELEKAGYSTWSYGEPNNPQTELCGAMYNTQAFNNLPCSTIATFICEKETDSLLSNYKFSPTSTNCKNQFEPR